MAIPSFQPTWKIQPVCAPHILGSRALPANTAILIMGKWYSCAYEVCASEVYEKQIYQPEMSVISGKYKLRDSRNKKHKTTT